MNTPSDKKRPRMLTPEELASAPKTQALMVDLIDRPEKAAAKVKGEVPQLQAGIIALFEALTECGTHAASLERALGAANRRADARAREACTFEKRTACSFASSAIAPNVIELLRVAQCPACDGSGAIPHQIGEGDWELQQCQWCDERQQAVVALSDGSTANNAAPQVGAVSTADPATNYGEPAVAAPIARWVDGLCKTCLQHTYSCKCQHPNSAVGGFLDRTRDAK